MDGLVTATDIALAVTLWASAAGIAMQHGSLAGLTATGRRGVLLRVVVLDVVLVPLVVWMLTELLNIPPDQTIGLLLVGAASAGPLGLKATQIARGNVVLALQLVILLELANLVVIPLWSTLLLPDGVSVHILDILRPLVLLILAPTLVGAGIRAARPQLAARLAAPLRMISSIGLVIVVVLLVARHFPLIVESLDEGVPLVALLAVVFAMVAGWIAGAPRRPDRTAAGLVTGIRANAPALAVAQAAFPDRPAVAVTIVVFGLISGLLPLAIAVLTRIASQPGRARRFV